MSCMIICDIMKENIVSQDNSASSDNFERFKKCAAEVLAVEESRIVLEADFAEDLEADSLDIVELVMTLEEEFDVGIDEEELEGVTTVSAAYNLIVSKL